MATPALPSHLIPPASHALLSTFARLLLLAAGLVVAFGVFAPAGDAPSVMPWDKAEHFTAFYGLALLALCAFPSVSAVRMSIALSVAGGLVELIQGLPIIHRDCDWMDWVADSLGIAAAMAPLWASQLRRRMPLGL